MLQIKLNPIQQFLCEILCHDESINKDLLEDLFNKIGEENALKVCEENHVTSIAAYSLSKCKNVNLSPAWKTAYDVMNEKIQAYMNELDKAAALLKSNSIPLVALKNSGITRSLYKNYGASPMGDIDVLVRKSDFRKAHKVLVDNGYVMKFRSPLEENNIDHAEQGGGAEYSVNLPSGGHLWFELQWRPVAGRWIRQEQEPSSETLMDRSLEINNSSARILSPEDNLIQVALHTAKHSYVRAPGFRLHTDVDRVVRESIIDWNIFTKRVTEMELKTAVFFSLALAHELIRTPIPKSVLIELSPSRWKKLLITKWLLKVGLFNPDSKKWGRVGYILFVIFLYDDFTCFWKSLFPSKQSMREKYGYQSSIPVLHFKRILDLIKNRVLVK